MKHTTIPSSINTSQFSLWGNTLMMSSHNFSMKSMHSSKSSPSNFNLSEEETGCAIATAVFLGIGNPENYDVEDSISGQTVFEKGGWNDYSMNVFNATRLNDSTDFGNQLGYWIASQDWSYVDDSAKGAGQRILYALENGVPDWKSIMDMISGNSELLYTSTEITVEDSYEQVEKIDISKYFKLEDMVKDNPSHPISKICLVNS